MSWQVEMREALKSVEDLNYFFADNFGASSYPIFIPKRLALKIKTMGKDSALGKQFLPLPEENNAQLQADGLIDPIGDQRHSPHARIVHRYDNRILFFPTSHCPVMCRYCFRKNELNSGQDLFSGSLLPLENYLRQQTEIDEVIFSGGDPLILSDEKIAQYLDFFAQFPNIKYIRFHSRMPVIIPNRISDNFISILQSYSKRFDCISLAVHINHTQEIDSDVKLALKKFENTKIQLLSQTVLLKNVNDDATELCQLFKQIWQLGMRPYYLHHPDRTKGAMHFCLSPKSGGQIMREVRRKLPGWMLPQYVIDDPSGKGKIPLSDLLSQSTK